MASDEASITRPRRKRPRWPISFLILYALALTPALIQLELASVPGGSEEGIWIGSAAVLALLTPVWLVLCVVYLVRHRRFTWWMAVGPVLYVAVLASYWHNALLQARFDVSEPWMTHAAKSYTARGLPYQGRDQWLGLYRISGVGMDKGGYFVVPSEYGGFLYVPEGKNAAADPDLGLDSLRHLRGPWWAWSDEFHN